MSDIAIQIKGLGKRYKLGGTRKTYKTLRESVIGMLRVPFHRRNRSTNGGEGSFWALKDVSFEINRGEVVGVIGRNGAGKSTLLKVLSRITDPTEGVIEIDGRVGSLLEVGTGFHPELTGRENVYLNGAILGMRRFEIESKFDEIVAFSGVEKFLDTPVKHYSSGMYTRLAFAVAAHLEPEILIVDEVLAVGDFAFQEKCLGKMRDIAGSGRTVIFVSHNMAAVEGLCRQTVVMDQGRVIFIGNQREGIAKYREQFSSKVQNGNYKASEPAGLAGHAARILSAVAIDSSGKPAQGFAIGEPIGLRIECECSIPIERLAFGVGIDNAMGQRIATLHTCHDIRTERREGLYTAVNFTCFAEAALWPGDYVVKLSLEDGDHTIEAIEQAMTVSVFPSDFYQNAGRINRGVVLCRESWRVEPGA